MKLALSYHHPLHQFLQIGIFFLCGLFYTGVVHSGDEKIPSAAETVESFQALLISMMKQGRQLGYDGRYKFLDQSVRETHAAKTISSAVLSRKTWRNLSDTQQKEFVEIFTQLSVATYAHYFKSYSEETFKFISEMDTRRGGKLVRTVFVESGGNEVQFDYLLKKQNGRWMIANIIADGVSDLGLKRVEYTQVLKTEGYAVLVSKLEEKIDNYRRSSEQ